MLGTGKMEGICCAFGDECYRWSFLIFDWFWKDCLFQINTSQDFYFIGSYAAKFQPFRV